MSSDNLNSASSRELPVVTPDAPDDWNGMTLEELRRARAKALIRREVGRATMQYSLDGVKSNVASNGMRALLFNSNTVTSLTTVDYVFLGFRLMRWFMGRRRRRR